MYVIPTMEERAAAAVLAGLPATAGWDEIWLRNKILEFQMPLTTSRYEVDMEIRRREFLKTNDVALNLSWSEIDAIQRLRLARLLGLPQDTPWTRLVDHLNDNLGCSYCSEEEPIVGWRGSK